MESIGLCSLEYRGLGDHLPRWWLSRQTQMESNPRTPHAKTTLVRILMIEAAPKRYGRSSRRVYKPVGSYRAREVLIYPTTGQGAKYYKRIDQTKFVYRKGRPRMGPRGAWKAGQLSRHHLSQSTYSITLKWLDYRSGCVSTSPLISLIQIPAEPLHRIVNY